MRELIRKTHWEEGDPECLRCCEPVPLYFNGGELDRKECCGLIYQTEHVQIDLVVYEKEPGDDA